jgi:superfamily II DNA/RNA helicase
VLATTSIGQEGLDFHQYCHAVVHWNLPSNPVDLEQREGRIHRYKNHAVRKNIAQKYAPLMRNEFKSDLWKELFLLASQEYGEKFEDIVPFWVFQVEGGSYIERHIPSLPLSREIDKSILLKRSLAAYRMVFGQTRQQDLVEYLMSNFKEEEIEAISEQLRIDLTPTR